MNTTTAAPIVNLPRGFYDPMSKTPDEWRAEAGVAHQRAVESWERSDTDGFLSQWANQQMQMRYHELARLAEANGMAEMVTLADVDGNPIEGARYVETQYGWSWVYDDANGNAVWCRESNHSNPEVAAKRNAAKGFQIIYPLVRVVMGRDGHLVRADSL